MSIELSIIAAAAGAITTIAAALTSALSQKAEKGKRILVAANTKREPSLQERLRIVEAKTILGQIESKQNLLQVSNICLVSGQFIIGGLLASSFLQEHLSPIILGSLGLIVLLSTMINQKFSPDAHFKVTKEKVIFLKRAIREADDMVFHRENGNSDEYSIIEIRKFMTNCLNKVESADFTESDQQKHQERGSNKSMELTE